MTHIMFSCPAAQFLWSFVGEALGTEWQDLDLSDFLETRANQTGKRRRLFWLVFAELFERFPISWLLITYFCGMPLTLCLNCCCFCSSGTPSVGGYTEVG
jgi:hypothetical protein